MRKVSGLIKYFTIAAIVILLLLFAFFGFLSYQDHASYKNTIHQEAGLIIKINRNQLIRKIGLNSLANPGYYFKADEKDTVEADEKEEWDNGFDTRANIFIFNLNEAPFTFYITLEVTDSAAFKTFLKDKFGMDTFEDYGWGSRGMSSDKKLQAAFDHRRMVISYAIEKRHNQEVIDQILEKKGMLDTDDTRISRLKDFDGDVVFINDKLTGSLNFEDGRINLSALLQQVDGYSFSEQSQIAAVDTSSSLQLSLAGSFSSGLFKTYTVSDFNIPLDSIMNNYKGYLDFKVTGKVTQADTIITYEYSDDFEKIETKSLQEKEVPGLSLMMTGNAPKIRRLLSKENIVEESRINSNIFPLIQLNFATEDDNTVRIYNIETKHLLPVSDSESVFFLYSNFSKLRSESGIPIPEELVKNLQKLEIIGSRVGDKVNVKGELVLTNKEINALTQLMD